MKLKYITNLQAGWGQLKAHVSKVVRLYIAQLWIGVLWTRYKLSVRITRHVNLFVIVALAFSIIVSVIFSPAIQLATDYYFGNDEKLSDLRAVFLTLGGSLIGATAIAFSLIMFAMQVNLERMPYGLFRKFSSDIKIMGAITATFVLALTIIATSIFIDRSWLAYLILIAFWSTFLIPILILYAYNRALRLVSPATQLDIIVQETRYNLKAWDRRAKRAKPLFEQASLQIENDDPRLQSSHDMARVNYFKNNPHWISEAQNSVDYAVALSRRYAENGDYKVSQIALNALVKINSIYVKVKRKTFFTDTRLFDHPWASDEFINNNLEHLRRDIQIGISRHDEVQIEQLFRTLAALFWIYSKIDYAISDRTKRHANLAVRYLVESMKAVMISLKSPDVMIEGLNLLGQAGHRVLEYGDDAQMSLITDNISTISRAGVVNEELRPITESGIAQLARITFKMICSATENIDFISKSIRKDVSFIVKAFLTVPDNQLPSVLSLYLAPYYSLTKYDSLLHKLIRMENELLKADQDDENANRIVRNIASWTDGIYQTEKDILTLAIEKRSGFTGDIVNWISYITKLLMAISTAPACDDDTRDILRNSSLWLISVLSWIPDEKEVVSFVETYEITETLFETVIVAHNNKCSDVKDGARKLLLSWGFKAGKHKTDWAILENAFLGLATFELLQEKDGLELVSEIKKHLEKEKEIDQDHLDQVARGIREHAATLHRIRSPYPYIESAINNSDHEKLKPLLEKLANQISPGTADEKGKSY